MLKRDMPGVIANEVCPAARDVDYGVVFGADLGVDFKGPTETTIAPSGKTIPGRNSPAGVPSGFITVGRDFKRDKVSGGVG